MAQAALVATDGAALVGRSLPELELVIERGLQTFVEVGQALKEIRDRDLHREAGYRNFDAYCQERWGFNRTRSTQLIAAAENVEVVNMLTTSETPAPANARQAHALNPLKEEPETMAAAWTEAVESAPNGKVTAAHVSEVVERYIDPTSPPKTVIRSEALEHCERATTLLERLTRRLRRTEPSEFALRDRLELDRLLGTVVRCLARADQMRPSADTDEPAGPAAPPRLSGSTEDVVVQVLRERGPMTAAELVQATGHPYKTVSARLAPTGALLASGRVVCTPESNPKRYEAGG